MPGPLEGLKVLEVAYWVAAPSACAIIADMGAEVVKPHLTSEWAPKYTFVGRV